MVRFVCVQQQCVACEIDTERARERERTTDRDTERASRFFCVRVCWGGGPPNNAQPAAKSHASPGQLCVDTAPRAAAGAVGAPPHEGDAPTTQQLLSQGSDTDSTLTKQPPTLAALITHAGWLVPPATQAYEFGMDSDDGSDFAISFDGSSWDVVASWCVCGACTRGWPLSLCCRCCCLCVCVLPAARVFAVDGLSARAPPGARPLPPPLSLTHALLHTKKTHQVWPARLRRPRRQLWHAQPRGRNEVPDSHPLPRTRRRPSGAAVLASARRHVGPGAVELLLRRPDQPSYLFVGAHARLSRAAHPVGDRLSRGARTD